MNEDQYPNMVLLSVACKQNIHKHHYTEVTIPSLAVKVTIGLAMGLSNFP